MAIESDIPNANSRLAVLFHKKAEQNQVKSELEGRPIFDDVIFIRKMVPGDSLNIIDRPIYESDKNEFPMQWAHFMNKHGDDQMMSGTPLIEWPLVTTAQAEELRALKFYTVEQVAEASDAAITKMGMSAGMSPYSFRDKARAFLAKAKGDSDAYKREEELNALKAENEKIKAENEEKLSKQQAQIDALMAMVTEKKPRGRKPKEEAVTE